MTFQYGFPDLYGHHPKWGGRWIDVKESRVIRFTRVQKIKWPVWEEVRLRYLDSDRGQSTRERQTLCAAQLARVLETVWGDVPDINELLDELDRLEWNVKLQVKRERWQCAVTAFAMALGVPVMDLMERLGHDGGEIIFPDLPEPANRRSHNIYELIQVATDLGYAVTPVPLRPAIVPAGNLQRQVLIDADEENWGRFTRHLLTSSGVIECQGPRCYHLLAYDRGYIFDPDGFEFPYSREACEQRGLYTYCLWRVERTTKYELDGTVPRRRPHEGVLASEK